MQQQVLGVMGKLLPYLITFLAGIATSFGGGFVKELFDEREQKRSEIRRAAKDIMAFVNEGMHIGFRHKATSIKNISLRAIEIEAIDEEVGKKLRVFLNCWSQYRDFLKRNENIDNDKMAMGFKNNAQSIGVELLETAKKWIKTGKT